MSKVRAFLRNPVVIIVPLVLVLWGGWQVYLHAINQPNHAEHNLLQNGDFELYDSRRLPQGWTVDSDKTLAYVPRQSQGFGGGTAFGLQVRSYQKGSADFKSPLASVHANVPYLHKTYYRSDVPVSLLIKYFYKDGSSSRLQLVKTYAPSKAWATASAAFKADGQAERVQVVYRVASKGTIWLDRAYVDQRDQGVSVPESAGLSLPNLVANSGLQAASEGRPDGFAAFHMGDNDAALSYSTEGGASYARVTVTDYKNGEAKWDHAPVLVEDGRYTRFSASYRSDVPVRMVAEYALDDRKRTFVTLAELPPARTWTAVEGFAEAPSRAVEVSMNIVLTQNGTLDTDDYAIYDLTKQGERHFRRPLVSITFDDGWASSYVTGARILGYLKYKATFYINPKDVDEPLILAAEQLGKLKQAGHQIASQGYEHLDLTTLNTNQLDRQMRLASDYFVAKHKMATVDFAAPNGHYDAEVQAYARTYYRSGRTTEEGLNTKQNFDVYNLKIFYVDRHTTTARLQAALDEAKQRHGWLVLVYRQIEDNTANRTAVPSKTFSEQMELIRENDIAVKTVQGALDELWGQ